MQHTVSVAPSAFYLAFVLVGCGGPTVDRPDAGGFLVDSGISAPPPGVPKVSAPAAKIPYPIATLHGTAQDAKRVIVEGADNPIATTVLPDGSFCIDVPMRSPGKYSFHVTAQGADGQISDPTQPIAVEFDPGAPTISGAATCTGSDPSGSTTPPPNPSACMDDVLEPNNDVHAPRVEPGRYDNLQICPEKPDYFGILAEAHQTIDVRIYFMSAMGQLDLGLYGTGDHQMLVAESTKMGDDQSLTYTATVAGVYVVEVYGPMGAANGYSMDLRVGP